MTQGVHRESKLLGVAMESTGSLSHTSDSLTQNGAQASGQHTGRDARTAAAWAAKVDMWGSRAARAPFGVAGMRGGDETPQLECQGQMSSAAQAPFGPLGSPHPPGRCGTCPQNEGAYNKISKAILKNYFFDHPPKLPAPTTRGYSDLISLTFFRNSVSFG